MAINSPLNIAAQPGKTRLRKSLKLWQVVMMGLAYLTPMTVFDTFGIVSGISEVTFRRPICWRWRVCCYRYQLRQTGSPVSGGRFGLYLRAKVD